MRSLRMKLILIMVLLSVCLMTVVGSFLVNGVRAFYTTEFYESMGRAFSTDFILRLQEAAGEEEPAERLRELLMSRPDIAVDLVNRNVYVLDSAGNILCGSDDRESVPVTANLLSAIGGEVGQVSSVVSDYMDVAVPVTGGSETMIAYVLDNRTTVNALTRQIVTIILEALAVGLLFSVVLAVFLARILTRPIRALTRGTLQMASGTETEPLEVTSHDEIGILTRNFNEMAGIVQRNEEMSRTFVANVSHELRTPLTNVRSYTETMLENPDALDPALRESFLKVVLSETDRMTRIVQDLLTLSRFDVGKLEMSMTEFPFAEALRGSCRAMVLSATESGHTLTLEGDEDLPAVKGDRQRLEQVLVNILSNAVKYTPAGGTIRVEARAENGTVITRVTDNGIGIPAEDLPHIFERFYRVDKARSRASGGTGLGLSIASEIIHLHGGSIEAASEVGKGTVFTVTLPALEETT